MKISGISLNRTGGGRYLFALACGLGLLSSLIPAADATTIRISTDSAGRQLHGISAGSAFSTSGQFAVFASTDSTLVPDDTNDAPDIFLKNNGTGSVERVNTTSDGRWIPELSLGSDISISANGRYVAFDTQPPNSTPGETNDVRGVYVKDTQTGELSRISTNSSGQSGQGNSFSASISEDGRYVAFASLAPNLVANDTNGKVDIFVKDTQTGTTTRASTTSAGRQSNDLSPQAPSGSVADISASGRYVAFESAASDFVPGDNNGAPDVFRKDLASGATSRVSSTPSGLGGNRWSLRPTISGDGRYVGFISAASNLGVGLRDLPDSDPSFGNVFVKDLDTNEVTAVNRAADGSAPNGGSLSVELNSNGRFAAFDSTASNISPGDRDSFSDVYIKDLRTRQTQLVSQRRDATAYRYQNWAAYLNAISPDGRFVGFHSADAEFVPDDSNEQFDVFRTSNDLITLDPPNAPPPTQQIERILLPPIYHRPLTLEDYLDDPAWLVGSKTVRISKRGVVRFTLAPITSGGELFLVTVRTAESKKITAKSAVKASARSTTTVSIKLPARARMALQVRGKLTLIAELKSLRTGKLSKPSRLTLTASRIK